MVLNWQADFRTWSADRVERAKGAAEASLADIVKGMQDLKSSDRAF
jgi:hypothetical protein